MAWAFERHKPTVTFICFRRRLGKLSWGFAQIPKRYPRENGGIGNNKFAEVRVKFLLAFLVLLSTTPLSLAQPLPEHAHKNSFGNGWSCDRGFHLSGNKCIPINIPENGKLNYLGNGWDCQRGFYKSRNQCLKVSVPVNGKLNYFGNDWDCQRGFYKSGNQCLKVSVPANAKLNYLGNGWDCDSGFKKAGNACVAMTPHEIRKQQELKQAIIAQMQKRKHQGVSGDNCELEYKTNAQVCVRVTRGNIDCNKSVFGDYYQECDVVLEYEVETNYSGGSYLDAEVECRVEIEYSGRQTFTTQSDSSRKDESHSLYALGSDNGSMNFNFSFSSFSEITRAKISSAKCEIEGVNLW